MISKSRPGRIGSPARSQRRSITSGRPIRIGLSVISSSIALAQRRTRSSSPSEKMILRVADRAASKTGRMISAERKTDPSSFCL